MTSRLRTIVGLTKRFVSLPIPPGNDDRDSCESGRSALAAATADEEPFRKLTNRHLECVSR